MLIHGLNHRIPIGVNLRDLLSVDDLADFLREIFIMVVSDRRSATWVSHVERTLAHNIITNQLILIPHILRHLRH